jgi:hypothetical protein
MARLMPGLTLFFINLSIMKRSFLLMIELLIHTTKPLNKLAKVHHMAWLVLAVMFGVFQQLHAQDKGIVTQLIGTSFCRGQGGINVTYAKSPSTTYNAGNVFKLELSNASGSFATPIVMGELVTTNDDEGFVITLPPEVPYGIEYRLRVTSSNPVGVGEPSAAFTILSGLTPVMDQLVCSGGNATFTTMACYPPESTSYQWYKMCSPPLTNIVDGMFSTGNTALVNDVYSIGSNVYAATYSGLARSTDNGATFNLIRVGGNLNVYDVTGNGNNIFVATNSGIWGSTDGGLSFTSNILSGNSINGLFSVGNTIYAATSQGIYVFTFYPIDKTFNEENHFTKSDNKLPSDIVNNVYVLGETLFAATSAGLAKSKTFFDISSLSTKTEFDKYTFLDNGLPSNLVNSVYVYPGIIFVGTSNGIAYSINTGASFNPLGLNGVNISDIYFDGEFLYAGTVGGLQVSVFDSQGFTDFIPYKTKDGLGQNNVNGIGAGAGGKIYIATSGGLSQGNFSISLATGIGANTNTLQLIGIDNSDALCKYFATVVDQATGDGDHTNFASLADIPPYIVIDPDSTIQPINCIGGMGKIQIKNLNPYGQYKIIYTGPSGIPASGSVIKANPKGRFNLKFLEEGTYDVRVESTIAPFCSSNTVTQILDAPDVTHVPAVAPPDPICAGNSLNFNITSILGSNEEYRWYRDAAFSTASSPAFSTGTTYTPSVTPPMSGSYWVRVRNKVTKCFGAAVKVDYIVNLGPQITITKTNPSSIGGSDGVIKISGLSASTNYTLDYGGPTGATPAPGTNTITTNGFGETTISGLKAGDYTNISITTIGASGASNCQSNIYPICSLFDPLPPDAISTKNLQTVVCNIPGTLGGYLHQVDVPLCDQGSVNVEDMAGGIAVGRIRQSLGLPLSVNDQREMRGYVQFDLSRIPTNATIAKVEYRPKAWVTTGVDACDVPIQSATGDIQFDVTQMSDVNYAPYANFNSTVFQDMSEVKYNDFVIASDMIGALTDLGTNAAKDVQRRIGSDKKFQLGLHLSGSDFDLPVFQFHGIVFAPSEDHELCITYTLKDYGDLPEPKYATDLSGGLEAPSHFIDSIEVSPGNRQPPMFIGNTPPDAELDGQSSFKDDAVGADDEDLSQTNFSGGIIGGESTVFSFPVTNNLPNPVNLLAFIDWNSDGIFDNSTERYTYIVQANTSNYNVVFNINVPKVTKSDSIGVRVRMTSTTILDAYGQAGDGEVEDFIVELHAEDFGDLPDNTIAGNGPNDFNTIHARNGARHAIPVVPLVYMGNSVDTEVDAQPNTKSNGDDLNPQVGPNDEDGIVFLTPLVPGYTSQVAFTGRNQSNADATLYVYTDWTNDGVLDLATTYTLAANSTASAQSISFYVPANATFEGGKAFFRFRLTADPEFNAAPSADGVAIDGEVEDYYVPLFKLGNLVWEDRNNNGFQDAEEVQLGIQNVRVVMRFGGIDPSSANYDEVTKNTHTDPNTLTPLGTGVDLIPDYVIDTFTNANGLYGFTGMIEGNYQIIAVDTFGLTPTRFDWIKNVTEEDRDSDGKPLKNFWEYATGERRQSKSQQIKILESQIGILETGILDQTSSQLLDPNQFEGFPDNKVEHRLDFGYIGLDLGDLAESGNDPSVSNFVTSENGTKPEGPKHIVTPDLRLGKYQDVEWQGQADQDAGEEFLPGADAGGDDPIADFNNYPGSAHDPSQSRHWPFHVADDHDDEDGIKFLSPMVAGYDAVLSVKYSAKINFNGPDAYLHAWMDWNGDGNFDDGAGNVDKDEHIIFYKRDGVVDANMLEANTQAVKLEMSYLTSVNDSIMLTFKVPADVKYNKGNVLSRFRISFDPQLGPNGILAPNLNFPDPQPGAGSSSVPGGIIPYGEVEDYFIALAKVSSIAWQDQNYNGKQDEGEVKFQGQPVKLEFAGLDGIFGTGDYEYTYFDTTDATGKFVFCGLIGSKIIDPSGLDTAVYRLTVNVPGNTVPVFNLPAAEACSPLDIANSDGAANSDEGITQTVFSISNPNGQCATGGTGSGGSDFPDTQTNGTINFGFSAFDYGDLPVEGTNYLTFRDSISVAFNNRFGPRHIIQSRLYLGSGVDGERNGQPDADAGSKDGGDDDVTGLFQKGTGADDETGIRLLTPLIPGEVAYLQVSYTSQDTVFTGGFSNRDAYLRSFIDFNGDGDLDDLSDIVDYSLIAPGMTGPFSPTTDNVLLAGGINQVQVLAFRVPVSAIYRNGTAYIRHRLSWNSDPLGPDNNLFHLNTAPFVDTTLTYPKGEVEDYAIPVAKIGNLAWFDHDVFGDQDANEDVVDSLHLVLIWGGVDGTTGAFDTVGYQTSLSSLGSITDILYNLTIAPPSVGTYAPGALVKTAISPAADSGLYSFRGLIPGIYYVLPMKYFATDSASFVNAWPKHRVVTLQDNPGVDDNNDSDGLTKGVAGTSRGPGAFVKITDSNSRQPEVEVNDRPLSENGKRDADDNANPFTTVFFPDNQWDRSVDFGWVDEPNIEANLDIVGVIFPTSQICGNFNVIMHLCVKNPQEVPLDSLQAFLDLQAAYGNALYTGSKPQVSIADSAYIKGPAYGKFKKSQLSAKQQLVPNPNYDGVTDLRLLMSTSENTNFLLRGDSIVCIRIEFEIDPSKTDKYPWMSQGSATARAVGLNKQTGAKRPLTDYRFFHPRFGKSIVVSDLTDEVNDPMPGSDMIAFEGTVADRGYLGTYQTPYSAPNVTGRDKYADENDKTVQNDECWLKTRWNSGIQDVRVALNSKCESIINANVFVPNVDPTCGFDKYTEGSYYAVIIQDKWTLETVWHSNLPYPFDAKQFLGRNLIYKVRSVANHCNSIWGDFILEDKIAPVVRCAPDTDRKVVGTTPTGTYSFVCTDIDSVLNVAKSWTKPNYSYYTGIAVGNDSCGQTWLDNVKDVLEIFADCDVSANTSFAYARITRTFTFVDEKNNKITCNQFITFRRPKIILPECRVEIPNNLSGLSKDLVPADLIKAPFNLTESVPYYLNGAGKRIYLTGRDYCGFALNFTDESVFNVGACGKKIIRRWTILDWCYGTKGSQEKYPVYHLVANADSACYAGLAWNEGTLMLTWEQQLIVGDNGKPIVSIPDYDRDELQGSGYQGGERDRPEDDKLSTYDAGDVLTISTGPMECKGGYFFTRKNLEVTEQSSWCFDLQVLQRAPILDLFEFPTGKYEWKTDPGVTVKGDCDKGYAISGIPMLGNWFLRLRVYDVCNKDTLIYYPIRAVDKIAPVMKSDNKLILSLNNGGLGFVSAEQFDEGSWDNCTRLEWKRLRRPVSNLVNANFIGIKGVVDANENGKIDAYSSSTTSPQDYVDVNRNRQADPEEYFKIDANTSLLMTPLMDSVPFFCADRGSVMLELWGNDIAGNRSYSWGNVLIEDKTIPVCSAPWTISVSCDDKSLYFIDSKVASAKAFGDVLITSGNLCADFDTAYAVVKRLKCGAGTIERIWTLTKQTSKGSVVVTCKQIIRVLPLREYNICFPKDADQRDCKTPVIDTAFTKELGCDILAVNVTDKHYDASNDECYKIFRTYTVIDWCAYDDNCGDPTADGIVYEVDRSYSNYGQTPIYVLVRDADQDQREEFYLSLNDTPKEGNLSDSKVGTDNDEAFVPAYCENAFSDNPYGLPVGEFYHAFQYTQIIKVYDEVKPVVTGDQAKFCIRDGGDCLADLKMIVKGTDNCTDQVTLETNLLAIAPFQTREAGNMIAYSTSRWSTKVLAGGQFEINVSNLPQGKHDLIVVVRDECGNLSEPTRIPFTVEDCKGPAPICINGLSTNLMPDGSGGGLITVWATDFVASKVFDCNGQGPETSGNGKLVTKYSINRVGSPASENQTSMVFNCKEAGKIVLVELHAWDNAGNHDFCVSFVEVQDNRKVCETGNANLGSIIGVVTTDQFLPLPGVAIDMNGASALKQTTANSGVFAFTGLSKGADFSLSAQLDKDHINGVSTFDLVVIQKHILGVKLIDNPYRQIAADVNNSKSITTLDMIQIRKLILQVDDKFKSVPSWKFVDASYKFPNASNPFGAEYPEVINVNNLNGNVKADFVAIKMGDVNGNASTVNGIAATEIRSNRHLLLTAEEQAMKVDGSYEVTIRAKDLQSIQGYQFTLTYAQNLVELEGIEYGVAKADNFGIFKNKGAITTSWNLNSGVSAAGNEVLFTLKLKAKVNTKLSEVLKLSSQLTPAEAYDKENESIGVKLSFGAITSPDFAVLRQNKPNPFSDETSIGFYLPKAAKGILSIRDSKGSLIYRVDGTYSKGENKVVLKQAELRASGVLYYTLETADFVDTKKMILLNP